MKIPFTKAHGAMNDFLRHTLATLAYRGGKVMRNAPEGFADFRAGEKTRTPLQIVAHIGDLLEWGMVLARGEKSWKELTPQSWDVEVERFFALLSGRAATRSVSLDPYDPASPHHVAGAAPAAP